VRFFGNPTSSRLVHDAMRAGLIDYIDTPAQGNTRLPGVTWCADNGCFGKGYPGDTEWFAWLEANAGDAATCLFAVAPDVVGDAAATLERSRPWLPKIRALGYRAALVAQDGLTADTCPWDEFDVLFIGGTTGWKLGREVRRLAREAKQRGKHVHMGRVNSEKRFRYAQAIGCDSVDGTYLTFGPDVNLPDVLAWLRLADHTALFDLEAS
jgi:hypothetical protein